MPRDRSKNHARSQASRQSSPMQLRRVAISTLKPAPYNPRADLTPGHPTFEKLRRSIDTFGTVEPIVWNSRTGHVVGGHQRLSVLKHLGHSHVDVVVVDLDLPQEKTLNLALNRIVGEWDEGKLAELLKDLLADPSLDLGLTGFDSDEIDHVLANLTTTDGLANDDAAFDFAANLQSAKPAVTKSGELILLGEHRLLCGDCTIVADVQRVMDGQRAVLFATDPPYLVDYDGTNHPGTHQRVAKAAKPGALGARSGGVVQSRAALPSKRAASTARPRTRPTKNKDWSGTYGVTWDDADANCDLYDKFIEVAVAHAIAPNAAWYCWHASKRQAMVEATWVKHGAFVHCQIIWAKNRPVLTRTWYAWQHEPCLMGWIQGNNPQRSAPVAHTWPIPSHGCRVRSESAEIAANRPCLSPMLRPSWSRPRCPLPPPALGGSRACEPPGARPCPRPSPHSLSTSPRSRHPALVGRLASRCPQPNSASQHEPPLRPLRTHRERRSPPRAFAPHPTSV